MVPSTPQSVTQPLPPKREVPFWQQLTDWQIWAITALLFLFVAYIGYRLWLARRAKMAENAPLLTRKTEFRNTDPNQFANTVFGMEGKNANDVHQQWFNKKNT